MIEGFGSRPHIVVVLVDDMGYHNIHAPPVHINAEIKSPFLASIAAEGVTLTQYYAYKYCGPSRASFLTGRLPGHGISEEMWSPAEPAGYNANLSMLPQKLKEAGYISHAIGKWHCGFWQRKFLPTSRGFSSYVGYLSGSEDHFTQTTADHCANFSEPIVATDLWQDFKGDGGSNAFGQNGSYSAFLYTSRAVHVIKTHAETYDVHDAPLFLYIALQNIHGPIEAEPEYLDKYDTSIFPMRRTLDAMVSTVDDSVRNISVALDEAGMTNDTLLVVMSDNGGPIQEPGPQGHWSPGNNFPLRSGKYSFFEGGVKVVAMLRYPRLLQAVAGTAWGGIMHHVDWWPTFCHLAGIADPNDNDPRAAAVKIDGINVWPSLSMPLDCESSMKHSRADCANTVSAASGGGFVLRTAGAPRTELLLGMGVGLSRSRSNRTGGGELPLYNGMLRQTLTETLGNLTIVSEMKLLVGSQHPSAFVGSHYPNSSTPTTVWPPALPCRPACLYNLSQDPVEAVDLAPEPKTKRLLNCMLSRYKQLVHDLYSPDDGHGEGKDLVGSGLSRLPTDSAACALAQESGWWRPWG